jgi:acetyl esterase/lipase
MMASAVLATAAPAQEPQGPGAGRSAVRPVQSERFRAQYLRIGNQAEGLLYEPTNPGARARIALIFSHPNRNTFNEPLGREMSARGYRVLMVNYRGDTDSPEGNPEEYLPSISLGIGFLRSLPGVQRVVVVGHSGGGHLVSLYDNVAEHGPSACQGAEKIYPCPAAGLENLARADAVILLDSTLGAFHQMSAVDPAVEGTRRNPSLDMFIVANGYDTASKKASYSAAFARRFYAAQAARNTRIVDDALLRLRAIQAGHSDYSDDEPLVIRGMGVRASGARLYQPDTAFAAHTKKPQLLLKADGTDVEMTVPSVRPPEGQRVGEALRSLELMTQNTTVKRFLAASAIRTGADYAITADDIVGVDWRSSYNSTPANAEGISVPALVLTMSCHYLIVPGEIIFDHLASRDKTYAAVEGATHGFAPCRPEYGDTTKRAFDFVDEWLSKDGRL